jgi:hypothetical protein
MISGDLLHNTLFSNNHFMHSKLSAKIRLQRRLESQKRSYLKNIVKWKERNKKYYIKVTKPKREKMKSTNLSS